MRVVDPLADHPSFDAKALADLRREARLGNPEAARRVATQFEALVLSTMLKTMREAMPSNDPLASDSVKLATSLFDGQLAQNIAGKGLGLAEVIMRQLQRATARAVPIAQEANVAPAKTAPLSKHESRIDAFVGKHRADAAAASRATGIPAEFILGQAALESGWGRREIRAADGSTSHNLFGIKAGTGWNGRTVETVTTEFVDGVAQKRVERFRAYGSYAEAFEDYARLLKGHPRYAGALQTGRDVDAFAQAMGRSGYATDPQYGAKLAQAIQATLRAIV
jgi:flagellar protein FlgJ